MLLNSDKFGRKLALNLLPNHNLVDSHFVALARRDNHSRVISNEVATLNCYYQSKGPVFAALDICDGLVKRLC